MSAIDWTTIEDAIWDCVKLGSGLGDNQIVWDYYKAPRPIATFVELGITEVERVGMDWRVTDDAPDPAPGVELRVRTQGHRMFRLTVQVFGATDAGNVALPIMTDILSVVEASSYELDLGGAGLSESGSATLVQGKRGGILEPRARCEFTFHTTAEVESRQTYIETIDLTITAKSETGDPLDTVSETITLT